MTTWRVDVHAKFRCHVEDNREPVAGRNDAIGRIGHSLKMVGRQPYPVDPSASERITEFDGDTRHGISRLIPLLEEPLKYPTVGIKNERAWMWNTVNATGHLD
jgi:hypothetical protein